MKRFVTMFVLLSVLVLSTMGIAQAADVNFNDRDVVITVGSGSVTPLLVQNASGAALWSVDESGEMVLKSAPAFTATPTSITSTATATVAQVKTGRIQIGNGVTLTIPTSFTNATTGAVGVSVIISAASGVTAAVTITGGVGGIGAGADSVALTAGDSIELYFGSDFPWVRGGYGYVID